MHKDPPRLIDDLEISGTLRNDVMHASDQHHAYAAGYDSASKLAAFQTALAAGASPAAAAPLGASVVKGVIGIAGAVALIAASMTAGAAIHARWQASTGPAAAAHTESQVAPPAAPLSAPVAVQAVTVREQAPSEPATIIPTTAPAPATHRGVLDATQQELRQLARMRAHLQAKQPKQALQLAERANRELGESALWQEREALAVLALFALEQTAQAERRAHVLLERFPDSPFRAELEQHLRHADAP